MNTKEGYSKLLLGNNKLLLSGGGDKSLSDFIGSLRLDGLTIQYKKVGDESWSNLATIPTKSSWNYNDTYITLVGTGTGDNASKLFYTINGTSSYFTVPYATSAGTVKEAYIEWGGRNLSELYSPIDASMVNELGACRTMFAKSDGITIQYSTDGGSNWIDYGASADDKTALFSSGTFLKIGKNSSTNVNYTNYRLRVILSTSTAYVYTVLNKFVIYVSTNGSTGSWCTIEGRLQSDVESNTNTWNTFASLVGISGLSGYNVINTSDITTYGNKKSIQYGLIRFTFGNTGYSASYSGLQVRKIMGFGGVGWWTPSTMAKTGHLYAFDSAQNATFPASVTAASLVKSGGTSAQFLKADGSVDNTTYYSVPTGGIPKSDLESAVLTSLGKADTALQSFTETDPTVSSWAKAASKPSYNLDEVTDGNTRKLANYLPLSGGIVSGAIKRYYSAASNNPMIALTSNNLDVWLWRINRGTSASVTTSGVYGFGLKYIGSGNSNNLVLYADNLNGTLVAALTFNLNGTATFTSNVTANEFYASSDLRKKNIKDIVLYNYKDFANIQLVEFEWKDKPGEAHLGVIAQDVEKYIPELVKDANDSLSVDYATLGTLSGISACKKIKELEDTVKMLLEEIKMLKNG